MRNIFFYPLLVFIVCGSLHAQTDTLRIPRFVVKTSVGPVFALFSSSVAADIGGEFRMHKHYSLDFNAGLTLPGLVGSKYLDPEGYFFSLSPRRYFLVKNGMYLGVRYTYGQDKMSYTVQFTDPSFNYFKRTRITGTYHEIYPMIGWHSSVLNGLRWTIDFSVGPYLEFRKFSYTNFNEAEMDEVMNGNTAGLEQVHPNRPVSFRVMFWIDVGFVLWK